MCSSLSMSIQMWRASMSSARWLTLSWTLSTILTNRDQKANGWEEKQPGSLHLVSLPLLSNINQSARFWELAIQTATPTAQRRFVDTFGQYMYAVVQQAEDRTQNHIRTLDSYLDVRRDTIGAKPSFAILELEMDLPDDVFNHPTLENLRTWVIDMLCIGNVCV